MKPKGKDSGPTCSVIIPVYNSESYLEDCIRSVLNQTFTNYELILIDDGSSDKSREICMTFSEQVIAYMWLLMMKTGECLMPETEESMKIGILTFFRAINYGASCIRLWTPKIHAMLSVPVCMRI